MTAFSVIALLATPTSGAAGTEYPSADSRAQSVLTAARVTAPDRCQSARKAVRWYRGRQGDWLKLRGVHQHLPGRRAPRNCADARYLAGVAKARSFAARQAYERWQHARAAYYRRLYEKWRCIHEHEGAWNDPNAPHYGGLQFDDDFQRTYGPEFFRRWGDAGNWPVRAQLIAAERAYKTRGFGPWPNTRRMCGL